MQLDVQNNKLVENISKVADLAIASDQTKDQLDKNEEAKQQNEEQNLEQDQDSSKLSFDCIYDYTAQSARKVKR